MPPVQPPAPPHSPPTNGPTAVAVETPIARVDPGSFHNNEQSDTEQPGIPAR